MGFPEMTGRWANKLREEGPPRLWRNHRIGLDGPKKRRRRKTLLHLQASFCRCSCLGTSDACVFSLWMQTHNTDSTGSNQASASSLRQGLHSVFQLCCGFQPLGLSSFPNPRLCGVQTASVDSPTSDPVRLSNNPLLSLCTHSTGSVPLENLTNTGRK